MLSDYILAKSSEFLACKQQTHLQTETHSHINTHHYLSAQVTLEIHYQAEWSGLSFFFFKE